MQEGREGIEELGKLLRSSLAIVRMVDPSFDVGELTATVERPDQLIVRAQRALELLTHEGENVPGGQPLIDTLTAAIAAAEHSWSEAQASRVELQQKQAAVREHALAFNRGMVALRRILRAVLGTHHLDFQALRASRVSNPEVLDEDDSVVEEEAADPFAKTAEATTITNGNGHNVSLTTGVSA